MRKCAKPSLINLFEYKPLFITFNTKHQNKILNCNLLNLIGYPKFSKL